VDNDFPFLQLLLAWISTAWDEANIFGFLALLNEAERAAVPPGDGDGFVDEAGGEDDREQGNESRLTAGEAEDGGGER
jgi:hypothetical protein